MADIVDIAQEQEELLRAQALRHVGASDDGYEVDVNTPRYCEDCDEQIPLARVRAVPLCIRCVECQEIAEKWR